MIRHAIGAGGTLALFVLTCAFFIGAPQTAQALECGSYDLPNCQGAENQFAGGFNPGVGYGGFGGGNCTATRTPVVFVHGNGENAVNWDAPPAVAPSGYSVPTRSVYEELRAQGYNDCELFGVTYLSYWERKAPQANYHKASKQRLIVDFIQAVKNYTGHSRVDVVGHSLGVSMALSGLTRYNRWNDVRRFVNIAGGIRGLKSCLYSGYANPLFPTCGAMNAYDYDTFGFYPSTGAWWAVYGRNDWTGGSRNRRSMRWTPYYRSSTEFYTIHAGKHDQVACTTLLGWSDCDQGPLFYSYGKVRAQLNVGAGGYAIQADFDFSDKSAYNLAGGDKNGVGHFNSRINSGKIIAAMLRTNCTGASCKGSYNHGPVVAQ